MIVCLATYGERMAALLENATELRFFEMRKKKAQSRGYSPMPKGGPASLAETLLAAEVKLLICGGVNEQYADNLRRAGLTLHAWIAGDARKVLDAWIEDRLEAVTMPGGVREPEKA